MESNLNKRSQKVQDTLKEYNVQMKVLELPASTGTAKEAAQAVGCIIDQIVKSLVLIKMHSKLPVLVLASGPNRVNEKVIGELVGEPVEMAKASYVRQQTGYSIGGVPPIGHHSPIDTYVDEHLLEFPFVWAAAGTPHSVFQISPDELVRITNGVVIKIN